MDFQCIKKVIISNYTHTLTLPHSSPIYTLDSPSILPNFFLSLTSTYFSDFFTIRRKSPTLPVTKSVSKDNGFSVVDHHHISTPIHYLKK